MVIGKSSLGPNISQNKYMLRTALRRIKDSVKHAYHEVRNVSFQEIFAYVLNEWLLFIFFFGENI